ncbi:MAG: hypothetical protein ACRDF5_01185 [bacterium]
MEPFAAVRCSLCQGLIVKARRPTRYVEKSRRSNVKIRWIPSRSGHPDERGVRQVHRQVAVLLDERTDARDVGPLDRMNLERSPLKHLKQRILRFGRKTQQVHRFGEGRPRGRERGANGAERRSASVMILVVSMQQRHKRPCVD